MAEQALDITNKHAVLIQQILDSPADADDLLIASEINFDELLPYVIDPNNPAKVLNLIDIVPAEFVSDEDITAICLACTSSALLHALKNLRGPSSEKIIIESKKHVDAIAYKFCINQRFDEITNARKSDFMHDDAIMTDLLMLYKYLRY